MTMDIPTRAETKGQKADGFCTPKQDKSPQKTTVLPRKVLPIVFLPGIMGSNLRLTEERQKAMGKRDNIAWRPDNLGATSSFMLMKGAGRERQLDPDETEVDTYDPMRNPTGKKTESSDQRHDNGSVHVRLDVGIETPLLMDDPVGKPGRRTKEQKARARGWGEVYFDSYRTILETCEEHLNNICYVGKEIYPWWYSKILGVEPATWQAMPVPHLRPITPDELLKAMTGCWFPIHAMGYNWLQSNRKSGVDVADRISDLIADYQGKGYQCEKVIVVTHSMGGLVARALIHPKMGNFADKVLGIVHGVMPAIGAAATYKRMRCGFEDNFLRASPGAKALGNQGSFVTAVLGNSPGGLELLPSQAYGNGWLQLKQHGKLVKSLPQKGDPYDEIYKVQTWYGLIREEWLDPAQIPGRGLSRTFELLDSAKRFHNDIADTYHPQTYAHYGADPSQPSWQNVVWNFDQKLPAHELDTYRIVGDTRRGWLTVLPAHASDPNAYFGIVLGKPEGPGDQTVPLHSSEHQLYKGKLKGVFRQTGYEHQSSYSDPAAVCSTVYSIVRIIETMTWSRK